MSRLLRRVCARFAWRDVAVVGAWRYQQNAVTGRRRVVRRPGCGGYSAVATGWLEAAP